MFVFLSFFFEPLYYQSFFDLRLLKSSLPFPFSNFSLNYNLVTIVKFLHFEWMSDCGLMASLLVNAIMSICQLYPAGKNIFMKCWLCLLYNKQIWHSLEDRRKADQLVMMYKIANENIVITFKIQQRKYSFSPVDIWLQPAVTAHSYE